MKRNILEKCKHYFYSVLALIGLLLLNSCASPKNLVYFQNIDAVAEINSEHHQPSIQPSDLISVNISAMDVEAARPFNLPVVSYNNINGTITGVPKQQAYLVDPSGNIEFPVLGKLHVVNLTRTEAIELIRDKLSDYINNPIVNLQILNYKVTILGEVRTPGTYSITGDRITILEGLGLAGDLTIQAKRENILVIREQNGKKSHYRIDLTDNKLFQSPAYYLLQNDVIYIEPNKAKVNSAAYSPIIPVSISVASTLIAVISLIVR